jgi:hypothetical protein
MLCGIGWRFNLFGGDVYGRVSDKGSSEDREQLVGFQAAEALGRFHHACRRPAGSVCPPSDFTLWVVLPNDQDRRCERPWSDRPLFLACAAIPSSISRRIASEREGLSFCCLAQFSIADLMAGGSRTVSTG